MQCEAANELRLYVSSFSTKLTRDIHIAGNRRVMGLNGASKQLFEEVKVNQHWVERSQCKVFLIWHLFQVNGGSLEAIILVPSSLILVMSMPGITWRWTIQMIDSDDRHGQSWYFPTHWLGVSLSLPTNTSNTQRHDERYWSLWPPIKIYSLSYTCNRTGQCWQNDAPATSLQHNRGHLYIRR